MPHLGRLGLTYPEIRASVKLSPYLNHRISILYARPKIRRAMGAVSRTKSSRALVSMDGADSIRGLMHPVRGPVRAASALVQRVPAGSIDAAAGK